MIDKTSIRKKVVQGRAASEACHLHLDNMASKSVINHLLNISYFIV